MASNSPLFTVPKNAHGFPMIQESRAKLQNLSHVAASTRPLVGIHWHTTSSGPTNFYLTLNLELNLFPLELFRKYLDGNSAQKKNTAFWGQKFPKLHCSYANKTSKRISQNRASACLIHFLPIVHIMLRCSHCNRMDFKSKHGLNLHLLKNAVCSALERQKLNPIQLPVIKVRFQSCLDGIGWVLFRMSCVFGTTDMLGKNNREQRQPSNNDDVDSNHWLRRSQRRKSVELGRKIRWWVLSNSREHLKISLRTA